MKDGNHVFCKPCRKHSTFCPCWQHGRFGVDCGVIGFPHIHDNVDLNFISTAERLAGGMLIRRKSSTVNEGIKNTGDLNSLLTWCVQQADFAGLVVGKDMSVRVRTVSENNIDLMINDWLRVNDNGRLDKITATQFDTNWEVVP